MTREAVIKGVSVDRVKAHIEKIVTEIPHRAAGSENGRRMAEYSRDALKANGIESARIHELPAIVSFPEHADFKVLTPTAKTIEANTLGHSTETGEAGVEGELIYVGSGAFADYKGIDVTGKIILTELSYSPARHEKQRIAALNGAVGAVMMNWGHPENEAVPFGSVKPVWGNPTPENFDSQMPTIPCIGIARTTGLELRQAGQSADRRRHDRAGAPTPGPPTMPSPPLSRSRERSRNRRRRRGAVWSGACSEPGRFP